ncbi:MAG: polyphosphate kinase 2 [Pseudomonadota bacterium]
MKSPKHLSPISKSDYRDELHQLQIELVKLHRDVIARGRKVLVIFEGRDAAGKDGVIKRIAEHLSPREVRVVALGKPSDREETQWYFQRFVPYLPAAGEIVLSNRSWYNRAGVERVMGFCTPAECDAFLEAVPRFEHMLIKAGVELFKYYLDISRSEQARRLRDRRRDPLKQWKMSRIDAAALGHWKDYSTARNVMLKSTHHAEAPWLVVRADDKRHARLNVIRDLLGRIKYPASGSRRLRPDRRVVQVFRSPMVKDGWLAR